MAADRLREVARVLGIGVCAGVLFIGAVGCGGSDDADTEPAGDTSETSEQPSSDGASSGSSSGGSSSGGSSSGGSSSGGSSSSDSSSTGDPGYGDPGYGDPGYGDPMDDMGGMDYVPEGCEMGDLDCVPMPDTGMDEEMGGMDYVPEGCQMGDLDCVPSAGSDG